MAENGARRRSTIWITLILLGLAGLVRAWRLDWQPLWWDEGYSVYFATEPLVEILRLTGQDIHPPFYYVLLRGWILLTGEAAPATLRILSLLIGSLAPPVMFWLARQLFPRQPLVAWMAALFLALSPMHLFYSQELRMYGLAMLLGMVSTGFFWQMCRPPGSPGRAPERAKWWSWAGYLLATAGLLYTEYFGGLLPLAHTIWALWIFRRSPGGLGLVLLADLAIGLAYLPWVLFAVPELIPYVAQKVVADADRPLGVFTYLGRHGLSFISGHVLSTVPALGWAQRLGPVVAVLSAGIGLVWRLSGRSGSSSGSHSGIGLLAAGLLLPLMTGFAVNLRMPFFPEGGERVLLFVLPYFLLLLALLFAHVLMSVSLQARAAGLAGVIALFGSAGAGIWSFYTVPRYTAEDYRPLIRQTIQQGTDTDTVFAVFPWQVGYWRAYAPMRGRNDSFGPRPVLSPSPAWNQSVAEALDRALERGKLWFPAHQSLGGILEDEIESYLEQRDDLVNFEQRWYGDSTRLSAWAVLHAGQTVSGRELADFGPVQLLPESALLATELTTANEVLPVYLVWRTPDPEQLPLRVSLRLMDDQNRVWSIRDFVLDPSWGRADSNFASSQDMAGQEGLLIPAGVPPGRYDVVVGVGPVADEVLFPVTVNAQHRETANLGDVQVLPAAEPLASVRLPMRFPLPDPPARQGVRFLGSSGYDPARPTTAGTELEVNVFVRAESDDLPDTNLYISLLDGRGAGVAGWEGWPLPDFPASSWQQGQLLRLPVRFFLPADLPAGRYVPVAGLLDSSTGEKTTPVRLAELAVVQRTHNFDPPSPMYRLTPPAQLGTHAQLLGYDLQPSQTGLSVVLYWKALQPLLPPHQLFVHLVDKDGKMISQEDGVPGGVDAPAPSGSWLSGEFVIDRRQLAVSPETVGPLSLRVGLYDPVSGLRLPVTAGQAGLPDAIVIPNVLP